MEIEKKIIRVGDSFGIVIDRVICNTLDLKKGDKIKFNIKKVIGGSLKWIGRHLLKKEEKKQQKKKD